MMEYKVDPARMKRPETGIYIRATLNGDWGRHDLAHLDRDSLVWWLDSKAGLARSTVLAFLGHNHVDPTTPDGPYCGLVHGDACPDCAEPVQMKSNLVLECVCGLKWTRDGKVSGT